MILVAHDFNCATCQWQLLNSFTNKNFIVKSTLVITKEMLDRNRNGGKLITIFNNTKGGGGPGGGPDRTPNMRKLPAIAISNGNKLVA